MNPLHINEIYPSLQGEGLTAGKLTVFIRTQGCSLRCNWCDTVYGLPFGATATENGEGTYMEISQIIEVVRGYGAKYRDVCLTGGDPLQQRRPETAELLKQLIAAGYFVTIETGGHVGFEHLVGLPHTEYSICMDYKLKSSGMTHRMQMENFSALRNWDTIKFVVGTRDDWNQAIDWCLRFRQTENNVNNRPTFLFSPVWGSELGIQGLAELLIKETIPELLPFQLSLQIHKVIWDPGTRKT